MVTVLLMLVISALVRVIERFNYTDNLFDTDGEYFGVIIGVEISIAWICCLLAEWITAMKFFDVSSQLPAIVVGGKPASSVDPNATTLAKTLGCVANVLVSVWPGFLYACTYYRNTQSDMKSIFWEFEISIWLNALCRVVSLIVLGIAMCRIREVVNKTQGINVNGTMICLNFSLLIFTATVQFSLMVFYSMGLIYDENPIIHHYTNIMMYVNVAFTCLSQVILSFIFSFMSEPIEIFENQKDGKTVIKVIRDNQLVYQWQQDNHASHDNNVNESVNAD